jgi:orotate phosphoribosyltransferase
MPTLDIMKYSTKGKNLHLRVAKGHFATSNSHSNYYIDVVSQKSRLTEAKAVAEELRSYFYFDTVVDTILCLDGTEVIGTCLAEGLTKADFINMNAHKTIYVVTPELVNGQFLFRDNLVPMIKDKHVMILAVSVATGKTVETAVDAVKYYGGTVTGLASIFSTREECAGFPMRSVFNPNDLPDYQSYTPSECPMCKEGKKLDALVNSHGFSKL